MGGTGLIAGNSASFYVVAHGRRSAPRMLAALAGVVHDRQRADGDEHNAPDCGEIAKLSGASAQGLMDYFAALPIIDVV